MTGMNNELRTLVDLRDRVIQKNRIGFGARIDAHFRGADEVDENTLHLLQAWHERFLDLEADADKDIQRLSKEYEIIDHMIEVKGIGRMLASKVVSMIDIERSATVSALWRYCGYGLGEYWVKDNKVMAPKVGKKWEGKGEDKQLVTVIPKPKDDWELKELRDRPVPGYMLCYNMRLKSTLYLVAGSFLKSSSPYRKIYDSARVYYDANRPDWTDGHKHNASLRKMTKMFISHLWLTWRQIEGLPVSKPYVHEKLGHQHNYTPQEFGWPEIAVNDK